MAANLSFYNKPRTWTQKQEMVWTKFCIIFFSFFKNFAIFLPLTVIFTIIIYWLHPPWENFVYQKYDHLFVKKQLEKLWCATDKFYDYEKFFFCGYNDTLIKFHRGGGSLSLVSGAGEVQGYGYFWTLCNLLTIEFKKKSNLLTPNSPPNDV